MTSLESSIFESPDVAWVELSRWNALTSEQQQKFPPIAPDFVIDLRSRTDKLSDLQEKMLDYRANGIGNKLSL